MAAPTREVAGPAELETRVAALGNGTPEGIPAMLVNRFTLCWVESLEGLVAGDERWATLGRCRARMFTDWLDKDGKLQEMRLRLQLWEQGRMDELLERVERARAAAIEQRPQRSDGQETISATQIRHGRKAAKCTTKKRYRKAMMAFSDKGRTDATFAEKERWTAYLIPTSTQPGVSQENCTAEQAWVLTNIEHGASDTAMYKHLSVSREEGQVPTIPMPSFPALTAPGPSGERYEHLQQCLKCTIWDTVDGCFARWTS